MKKRKFINFFLIFTIILFNIPSTLYGAEPTLELNAETAILMDASTGRILYSKEMNKQMYPASMTKILTALVMLDYIGLEEEIKIGYEINEISLDSSRAGHEVGEVITGENLLRGLIIPSGNETANVVALNVALRETNKTYLDYDKAEEIFMEIMNEKARSLGAVNSNFVTPHGYHDPNHYSTAYDMALITQEALKYDILKEIAMEVEYTGLSAGDNYQGTGINVEHTWISHNELIKDGTYYYPYATGLKTGFTSQAGNCLSATATKNDVELIAILFNNENEAFRWADGRNLFEYGFNNFTYYDVLTKDEPFLTAAVNGMMLDKEPIVAVAPMENFKALLSEDQYNNLIYKVNYLPEFLSTEVTEKGEPILLAPLTKGEVLGTITYTLNGEEIYTGNLVSGTDVLKRTLKSDFSYYFNIVKDFVFSWVFIPVLISTIAIISFIVNNIKRYKKRKRRNFGSKKKYKKGGFKTKY
ncbi:MAG: hypothetical protein ACK5LY_09110 [Lachnospirales bacterium]